MTLTLILSIWVSIAHRYSTEYLHVKIIIDKELKRGGSGEGQVYTEGEVVGIIYVKETSLVKVFVSHDEIHLVSSQNI